MTPQLQQHNGISLLLGRVLISLLFIIPGFMKISRFDSVAASMAAQGLPLSELLLIGTIALEVFGGLAILIGWQTRWASLLIFLFLLPVTFLFHAFWDAPAAQYQNQPNHFLKNLAVMGVMLYLAFLGAGPLSLDCARERATSKA